MYTTITLINTFRFSFQLLLEECFFLSVLPRRERFIRRLPLAAGIYFALIIGFYKSMAYLTEGDYVYLLPGHVMLYFFTLFLISFSLMKILFEAEPREYLFAGIGGYSAQHITFCLVIIFRYFWEEPLGFTELGQYVFYYSLPYLIVGILIYFLLIRKTVKDHILVKKDTRQLIFSGVTLVSCLVLSVFLIDRTFTTRVVCRAYGAISCTLGLYIQFLFRNEGKLEDDRSEMERILHIERAQTRMSQEAVEIINMKCHDLKHQLSALKKQTDSHENREFIQEITDAVQIYNYSVKTGNDILDLVLMQKGLLCDAHQIDFTYMADGEKLSFLSSADTASLFGNILDNAIEREQKEAVEKRMISMKVQMVGDMLYIHEENYCTDQLHFEEGLPITSKEDKRYHGFGVRSIGYIVKKYGGTMKMKVTEDRFYVDILFSGNQTAA